MTNDKMKYTSGHLDSEQLLRYQRRLMSEEEKRAVEKHFEECELCSDAVNGVEGMSDSSRIYPILRELKSRMKKRKIIRRKLFSTMDLLSIILIFFILGIILLVTFYFIYLRK